MSENEVDVTEAILGDEVEADLTEYTSETPAAAVREPRKAPDTPGAATGRRKEAVARVRIVQAPVVGLSTVARLKITSLTRCISSLLTTHSRLLTLKVLTT